MNEIQINPAVHHYTSEVTSRIVAKSGKASDRYHLGKIILQSFKDAPDFIHQIDGSTGESQTFSAALKKTVQCANTFRSLGLGVGDIVSVIAPNHLDVCIPIYAGLCVGLSTYTIERTYGVRELKDTFVLCKSKIVFCQSQKVEDVEEALKQAQIEARIVTFDQSDRSFKKFVEDHGDDTSVDDFMPTDINPEETIGFILPTSGTTGLPKCATISHASMIKSLPYWLSIFREFPTPTRMMLLLSPIQWLTGVLYALYLPIYRISGVQTSSIATPEHVHYLINTYTPSYVNCSPLFMMSLIMHPNTHKCDFTCFETIMMGGSAVTSELLEKVQKLTPKTKLWVGYGMTESGISFYGPYHSDIRSSAIPLQSVGSYKVRLVDSYSGKDIEEPNVTGELWIKDGPLFSGYHDNPKATEELYSSDGWLKTGDLFYRDQHYNYYFVERLKLLMTFRNCHISPGELETVIKRHPGILEVAVTSIPDPECWELPVACIQRKSGHIVTAQEIKDLVKECLIYEKQLHGGVIFMESLPVTPSTKIDRRKLKQLVLNLERE